MGCCGDREKGPATESAKWDYLTLTDFKCTSGWTYFAYFWLWLMAFVGLAVVGLDSYTAINLLAFNQWSSQVKPALDFKYSRWIFAVCILLSFVLYIYEFARAYRVIRRGGVAESFLDPTAATIQSIRPGGGWKRFLVFSDLTKSKKGADYVALFVYFAFKGAVRIILAEGPRQGVNAMTLWAVLQADLIPTKETSRSHFDQFWFNVQQLADQNVEQAMIYISMLVTLVIWVFSALSLFIAMILYITFLWHYIPQRDGRLSLYCRKKVDKRLAKLVEHKVKTAIEEEERKKQKAFRKEDLRRQKTGELPLPPQPHLKSRPTLPEIGSTPEAEKGDHLPEFPLARQDTVSSTNSLPPYSSQPPTQSGGSQRQPTLPNIASGGRPDMTRSTTQASGWSAAPSYSTNAPLLANAGHAGGRDDYPLPPPPLTHQDSISSFDQFHGRSDSQSTIGSRRPFTPGAPPGSRAQTPMSGRPYTPGNNNPYQRQIPPRMPLPVRSNTAFSFEQGAPPPLSNASQDPYNKPLPPPMRSNTADGFRAGPPPMRVNTADGFRAAGPPLRANTADGFRPAPPPQLSNSSGSISSQRSFSRPTNGSQNNFNRPFAPAAAPVPEIRSPSPESYEMKPQPAHALPVAAQNNGYVAFNPSSSSTPAPRIQQGPQRNITVTGAQNTGDYFSIPHHGVPQRSATAPTLAVTPTDLRNSNYALNVLSEYESSDNEGSRRQTPAAADPHQKSGPGQWQAY